MGYGSIPVHTRPAALQATLWPTDACIMDTAYVATVLVTCAARNTRLLTPVRACAKSSAAYRNVLEPDQRQGMRPGLNDVPLRHNRREHHLSASADGHGQPAEHFGLFNPALFDEVAPVPERELLESPVVK